jgi:uncharacterized membrane protein
MNAGAQAHPAVLRYLDALRAGLSELPRPERDEIVREIELHFGDAIAAGREPDEVLRSLGPADALARAYAVELLLNSRPGGQGIGRWFLLLGVLAATGLPALVLVPMLLTMGLVFTLVGAFVWLAGLIAPFAPPQWVIEVDPVLAVLIGPAITLGGIVCLALLVLYARFLVGWIRRTSRLAQPARLTQPPNAV